MGKFKKYFKRIFAGSADQYSSTLAICHLNGNMTVMQVLKNNSLFFSFFFNLDYYHMISFKNLQVAVQVKKRKIEYYINQEY